MILSHLRHVHCSPRFYLGYGILGYFEVVMLIDPIKSTINRAYDFNEKQQKALDEGQITEAE